MGRCYGQLSLEERVEIYRLHAGGKSQNEIASALDRAPSTISRELRRNSRPTKVWTGGYEPVRAQKLAERRRRWDGRFKLARQPDLRDCVGKGLAMGHSPEQIAGRLALEHGRVIISHESIYRFIYQDAAPPASSNNGTQSPNAPPRSKAAGRRAIGKPTSCCSPDLAKRCWFSTNEKPASVSFSTRSIEKLSSPPGLSLVNSANFHRRCAKPSASTTETSSPSITGFTKPSASRPSSAIPIAPGKKAAWKTPSGACDAQCHAKLTSSSSPQPPSSGTFGALTTPHANAWTSRHPPRHSPPSNQSLHFKRESIRGLSRDWQQFENATVLCRRCDVSCLQRQPDCIKLRRVFKRKIG
jgi:hypothetical protein